MSYFKVFKVVFRKEQPRIPCTLWIAMWFSNDHLWCICSDIWKVWVVRFFVLAFTVLYQNNAFLISCSALFSVLISRGLIIKELPNKLADNEAPHLENKNANWAIVWILIVSLLLPISNENEMKIGVYISTMAGFYAACFLTPVKVRH